jgi:hypothetical protein
MTASHERAAAPTKETAAHIIKNSPQDTDSIERFNRKNEEPTTLGFSLFRDPLYPFFSISDIRQRIELKYAACVALDGLDGHPIDPDRIRNPHLRSLGSLGRILKNWSVRDLAEVDGLPAHAADAVLIATLERPAWGEDDVALLGYIERLENLQSKAERSGRTL